MAKESGHPVVVPDLTGVAEGTPPLWEVLVALAVDAASTLGSEISVIGHSGAGALLPAIGQQLGNDTRSLIFVDAVVPPRAGAHHTTSEIARLLDEQTIDGLLRPWTEWWPAGTLEQLLPDPRDRSIIAGDLPVLPRSIYDEGVPVPDGWSDRNCGYLRLSHAYDREYEEAGTRGWDEARLQQITCPSTPNPPGFWRKYEGFSCDLIPAPFRANMA
jgi:hypothetical protein